MKEHFSPTASMRSTYPWPHLGWVLCSGAAAHLGANLLPEGFLASVMVLAVHLSLYAALMNLGVEHYRHARYKGAKKAYDHMLKRNEKLGWE